MRVKQFLGWLSVALLLGGCASQGEYFGEYDDRHDGKATTMKSYYQIDEAGESIHSFWRTDVCEEPWCQSMTYDAYEKDGKTLKKVRTLYTVDCERVEYQENRKEWYNGSGKMMFWKESSGEAAWQDFAREDNPSLNYRDLGELLFTVCEAYE